MLTRFQLQRTQNNMKLFNILLTFLLVSLTFTPSLKAEQLSPEVQKQVDQFFKFAKKEVPKEQKEILKTLLEVLSLNLPESVEITWPLTEVPHLIRLMAKIGPLTKLFTLKKDLQLPKELRLRSKKEIREEMRKIRNLMMEFDTVEVTLSNDIQGYGNKLREGSIYYFGQRKVIVNWDVMYSKVGVSGVSYMFTHEFLGALGYPDFNYEYTLALIFDGITKDFELDLDAVTVDPSTILSAEGGATGVGGGGDEISIFLKTELVRLLPELKATAKVLDAEGDSQISKALNKVKNTSFEDLLNIIQTARVESVDDSEFPIEQEKLFLLKRNCSSFEFSEITQEYYLEIKASCVLRLELMLEPPYLNPNNPEHVKVISSNKIQAKFIMIMIIAEMIELKTLAP